MQPEATPPLPFDRKLHQHRRDRAATGFHGSDFLVRRAAGEIADRIRGTNRRFEIGADLGSHTGLQALELGQDLPCLISCDLSHQMIRQAPAPRIVCDEEFLPFRMGSLDLVSSALTLHWVNDLPGTLIQARQALRPDGLFIAALFGGETLKELRESLMQAELECEGGVSPRISPFADVRDLGSLLQRAGFALPVVDADPITVRYETAFHLLRDLKAMGETSALNDRRRVPLRRQTLLRMAEIYQERFADADGRIRATFEFLYATGWAPHESQQKPLKPGSAEVKLEDALKSLRDKETE